MIKNIRIYIFILFAALMATGCVSDKPTPTQDQTQDQAPPSVAAVPDETDSSEALTSTATEYLAEINAQDPLTFRTYVLPKAESLTVVLLDCGSKRYSIFTPSNGIKTFNHCILSTVSDAAALVLPDGSIIFIGPHSNVQVNLTDSENSLLLKKGEVLSFLSSAAKKKFSILVADQAIQISDGSVAVQLKDDVLTVATYYYTNDPVNIQKCASWQTITCQKWEGTPITLGANEAVVGTIGSDDWQHLSGLETSFWIESEVVDLSFSKTILESYIPETGVVIGPESNDLSQYFNLANTNMQDYFISQFLILGIDGNDYNSMIYKSNLDPNTSSYCLDYPASCENPETLATPEWVESINDEGETDPGNSDGSPSGKFPPFDRSSCFSRSGHLWCFPVADSVPVSMSAEWDLTAICSQYPGEEFCSWSEVQNTLH